MKSCEGCKYAEWKRTQKGRLHPSGNGQCTFQWKHPPLPASMYFITQPSPCGGHISRHTENNEHCTYYNRGTP